MQIVPKFLQIIEIAELHILRFGLKICVRGALCALDWIDKNSKIAQEN